jgi:DNA-binding response OmpR family regulator
MAKSVLLVDDDKGFRQLVIPVLQARGLTVLEAGRLADATKLIASAPDLIIVDGLLPDGNGADWIKTLPQSSRDRPIIFVSAFWKSLKDHQLLLRDLGVALVVHKPISPDGFGAQLDLLFGRSAAPPLPPEVAREMEKLKAEYARELPRKLEELRRAVRAARSAPGDSRARQHARTMAHRLAGTAGSYGFPDESVAAGVVEAQCISAEKGEPRHVESCWALAEAAISEALTGRVVANG